MTDKLTKGTQTVFESIRQTDENGNEYWTARPLAKALQYEDFRNFLAVIAKAKEACKNSGQPVADHFVEVNEMVPIGFGKTVGKVAGNKEAEGVMIG